MHKPTNYAHTTFHLEANFKCLLMRLCIYDWSLILLFLCAIGYYIPNLRRSEQPRLLSQAHYLESLAIMMVCTMFLVTCASHYSYISPQLLCYTCFG